MEFKKDWKNKYQQIIDELESKEKTWGTLETLLRKAIGRLAIAGLGINKGLDTQLKDIQKISRKKKDSQLDTALDKLSSILNTLDAQTEAEQKQTQPEIKDMSNVLTQLLDLLSPPDAYQSSFEQFKKNITPSSSDNILGELANELNDIMALPLNADDSNELINEVILALLDRLSIIPGMNSKAKSIQQTIRKGIESNQWPMLLDSIAQEVNTALQLINDEKSELERFIAQVTSQLVEITGYIDEEQKDQQLSLDEVESFNLHMHEEMSKMHQNVEHATDINTLKSILDINISNLKENITHHLEVGKQLHSAAESRNSALSKQVKSMEKETIELKIRLNDSNNKLIYDTLTGVKNRMAYNEHIKNLMAHWNRYQELFSYTILDIDHFKKVNDSYGHNTGDKVLKLVAQIMQKNIRETDTLFRIGGEEFVLILPNTTAEQAAPTIEKLRQAVSQSGFRFKDEKVDIQISAGLTQVTQEDSEESLYERADKGLYQAKESGRNKLVLI